MVDYSHIRMPRKAHLVSCGWHLADKIRLDCFFPAIKLHSISTYYLQLSLLLSHLSSPFCRHHPCLTIQTEKADSQRSLIPVTRFCAAPIYFHP